MKPKDKELAAMYGDPNKITRGDIITATKKKLTQEEEIPWNMNMKSLINMNIITITITIVFTQTQNTL